jgi:zinc protease
MAYQLVEELSSPLRVEKYSFDNGLTLLYHPDDHAPLLSYQTWFKVGSSDEIPGKTGLAHLFEHLMFKGTKNYQVGEFDRILEEIGAQVNAATWLDWTYYHEELPSHHLSTVIQLEADRMQYLQLDQPQLKAEKKVVLNERQECVEDDPGSYLSEILWKMAFGTHPYSHPTIGYSDDIKGFKLKDCQSFYQKYYAPNQAIIVVSGAVQREALLSQIDKAYGHIPKQVSMIRPDLKQLPLLGPQKSTEWIDINTPRVILGFISPRIDEIDSLALELLNEVLMEGDSSRLYQKLFFEKEWVNELYNLVPQFRGPGLYEIIAELNEGVSLEDVEALILEEIEQIAIHGVLAEELEKGKNCLEVQAYRELQTLQQISQALGFWEATLDDFKHIFQRPSQIKNINSDQVKAIAQKLCDPKRRFTLYAFPKSKAES